MISPCPTREHGKIMRARWGKKAERTVRLLGQWERESSHSTQPTGRVSATVRLSTL